MSTVEELQLSNQEQLGEVKKDIADLKQGNVNVQQRLDEISELMKREFLIKRRPDEEPNQF